jgi:hypothetical protein
MLEINPWYGNRLTGARALDNNYLSVLNKVGEWTEMAVKTT